MQISSNGGNNAVMDWVAMDGVATAAEVMVIVMLVDVAVGDR